MTRKYSLALSLALLVALWPRLARAQTTELVYDDGTSVGTVQNLVAGDIEAVRFTPEHPARLLSVRLYFGAVSSDATVVVWGDNGGNAPDVNNVLWSGVVTPIENDWVEIDLSAAGLDFDPPVNFHVGQLLFSADTRLAWDGSGSAETRSYIRQGGDWFYVGSQSDPNRPADCLVRATVEYHDIPPSFWFSDVTDTAGVSGMNRVAWGDYDGDGDDDLLVNGNRLFQNLGDGTFVEVSAAAGIDGAPTNGGVWADYDNDGFLDFYATVHNYLPECQVDADCTASGFSCVSGRCKADNNNGPRPHDILYRNNGDGTFTDVSEQAGQPYDYLPTEGAAWGDMDNDGYVDLYVANYETPTNWTNGTLSIGNRDYLWRNNGDGTFSDASDDSGISLAPRSCGRGVNWGDFDNDGWQDIYVSNYRLDFNFLWRNRGGGRFENVSGDRGVEGVQLQGAWGHTIGSQWADVDNDGDWDLFAANLAHPRFIDFSDKSMLYINDGAPTFAFTDIREAAGITYSETHSDPAFADFDNDGFVDLFITDVYVGYRGFLYQNNGDLTFTDVTYPAGTQIDNGWGAAWADYDDDGDLDLISRRLYRNDRAAIGNFLKVRLIGENANRSAIGARVTVTAGGQTMMRQVEGGKGTTSQDSMTLHFGLGAATRADRVAIDWPISPPYREEFTDVEGGRTATYQEGRGELYLDAGVGGPDAGPPGPRRKGCQTGGDSGPWALLLLLAAGLGWRRRRRSGA